MKLGLIGLPMSGKTTIFNALTGLDRPSGGGAPGKLDVQLAIVNVPDPRLDALYEMYQPEKKVEAQITYADIGGLAKGIGSSGISGPFRNELNQLDGFIHVIRLFDNPAVPHPEETIDPQRDLELLDGEFLLADLITVEKRMEKLEDEMSKGKNRDVNAKELAIFERLHEALENEQPLRSLGLSDTERRALGGYGFLTLRPRLILLNLGEEGGEADSALTPPADTTVMTIQGELEAEIATLDEDDAALFMAEYGLEESARDRIVRASYALLNVQTFFTVGEDEVRAWSCPVGATAPQAAGVIHSDMERGFIRAEIFPVDLLLDLGSEAAVKQAGKLQVEGKGYVMQEGDVMSVRFNV